MAYHEDTITQSLALDLTRCHPAENRAFVLNRHNEKKYGSDFIWLIFSHDLGWHLRVAVQAKRLYANGRYKAFRSAQVKGIKTFADNIGGEAIYLTYNYPRILQSLQNLWIYGQPYWYALNPDYQRDLGLLYCYADDVDKIGDRQLEPANFAHNCFPMWRLCCICSVACSGDPLSNLILALSLGMDHRNISGDGPELLHVTPEFLRSWMVGKAMQEEELLEMLHLTSTTDNFDHEIEEFSPEIIQGTRLNKLA